MSMAAVRPPQVPPIPAGLGDNIHGSVFSGIYNPWTAPSTNFANLSTTNAVRGVVNNAGVPGAMALGLPRDLAIQRTANWYSPWLGYLNNSPPGFVSPYYSQECTSNLGCRNAPTVAGCRSCVGARGGSPGCANAVCDRDIYPGYYYRGYGDYYGYPGYRGYSGYPGYPGY